MIDMEAEVYTSVAQKVRAAHPGVLVSGEFLSAPASFPYLYLAEVDNTTNRRTQTNQLSETHADVAYLLEVFSNKSPGRKGEARALMKTADEAMQALGLTRVMMRPTPNQDSTIYRIAARYEAVFSTQKTIYRSIPVRVKNGI